MNPSDVTRTPQEEPAATPDAAEPDLAHIVTEDDTPVDNLFSEKQQRLLTEPLYSSWAGPDGQRQFVAMANVGLFYASNQPPLVPDTLLSLGVTAPQDLHPKQNRSYFQWRYGKPPEVVIEVVSNKEGGEADHKLEIYARIGVAYYVIFDPERFLSEEVLRLFVRNATDYHLTAETWLPTVGLGLTLWHGVFEGNDNIWLRWCDREGQVIPTGAERAEAEQQRAEAEHARAEAEKARADQLAALLRSHGIEPPA